MPCLLLGLPASVLVLAFSNPFSLQQPWSPRSSEPHPRLLQGWPLPPPLPSTLPAGGSTVGSSQCQILLLFRAALPSAWHSSPDFSSRSFSSIWSQLNVVPQRGPFPDHPFRVTSSPLSPFSVRVRFLLNTSPKFQVFHLCLFPSLWSTPSIDCKTRRAVAAWSCLWPGPGAVLGLDSTRYRSPIPFG